MVNRREAEVINCLISELASELDLHYEDEDFFALSPTIDAMRDAASIITESGFEVVPIYEHILRRYHRHRQ